MFRSRKSGLAAALMTLIASPAIADAVSDWNAVKLPPPPSLKEVTVDPSTTALLIIDMMKLNCNMRPRCMASFPNVKRLHDEARAHNMPVWFSLGGGADNLTPDDIYDPSIKPRDGEWASRIVPGLDKFPSAETYLRGRGIKTLIVCGTALQTVILGTVTHAALEGYKIILPVDCASSGDAFRELYAIYQMGVGGPPPIVNKTTLTRAAMVKF